MTDTQAQEAARLDGLDFTIEQRCDTHVIEWHGGGCRAANSTEVSMMTLIRNQAARIAELERAHAIAIEIGAQYAAERDALRAELARMREPLSDERIRALCKESWVFDTAQQWVRAIEAAHGITKTGGGA